MEIGEFELERYFAAYEFNVEYVLSASDPESLSLRELLALADAESRGLWEQLSLGYTESQGHPLLREEIAGLYRTIAANDVLVAAPEEAILLAMHAILRPGDEVIATWPAYQSLHEVARSLSCTVTPWPLRLAGQDWHLDVDFLRDHVGQRTRLVVVNFPHNPTGYLPDPGTQAAIVEVASERELYLFSDEMYWGLEYGEGRQLPAACDLYARAISLHGLSKSYALPGLRVGWLAGRDREILAACARWKDYTTICASAPSEVLALAALRAREQVLARNRGILRRNLEAAGEFFERYPGLFTWLPPQAGSVAFPALTSQWPVGAFCNELRARRGVLLAPARVFGYPGNHFRMGLGRLNFVDGIARVEAFLDGCRT